MELHVILAVLVGAALHAGWNTVIKTRLDRAPTVLMLALAPTAIAVPVIPFVPVPAMEAWPLVAAAATLHASYKLFLVQAYRHADMSQAYPLARGTAPPIVALASAALLGTSFDGSELLAMAAISAGVLAMALGGRASGPMGGRALFFALGTAVFTASYTMVDGTGARLAGTASGFILWMTVVEAALVAAVAGAARGRAAFVRLVPAWRSGLAAGAMSLGSYWIAVWAFTQAPIALVAALRESSIVFAALIAALFLRESVGGLRWAAIALIASGVVLMRL